MHTNYIIPVNFTDAGKLLDVYKRQAPNGYILSDEEHTVEIVEGKVTTITLSNQKKSSLSIDVYKRQ